MYSADNLVSSFQEALESYKDGFMSIRNLAEKSRIDYETDIVIFLNFLQGRGVMDITAVTPKHIHAYLSWLQQKKLAVNTTYRRFISLQGFFKWLTAQEIIAKNPIKDVVYPFKAHPEPRVLSRDEHERLIAAIDNPRDLAIIRLMLSGLTLGQVTRLTIDQVEGIAKDTEVTEQAVAILTVRARSKKLKTVPLKTNACAALVAWLKLRPEGKSTAMFLTNENKPVSKRRHQEIVYKYLRRAGISRASAQTLRNTHLYGMA